jgi:hypothetical protein
MSYEVLVGAIVRAIEAGEPLDLTSYVVQAPGQPSRSNVLPGGALREALLRRDVKPDPRGLRIRATRIIGKAELADIDVDHSLWFEGCAFEEPLDWRRMTVSGILSLSGCKISSITVDRAEINGGAFFRGLTATDGFRAIDAKINGPLILNDADLRSKKGGIALNLEGAEINGFAFLKNLTARGMIYAPGAKITGYLEMSGAKLINGSGCALNLQSARLGSVFLTPTMLRGSVVLAGAQIDELVVPEKIDILAPNDLDASGWRLRDIRGVIRHDRRAAADWLTPIDKKNSEFVAQPWHELANVYERNGHPADARWMRLKAARGVTRTSRPGAKLVRWIYGALTGHGYYPLRAALWLIIAVLVTIGIVTTHRADFAPTAANTAAWKLSLPASQSAQPITGATPCEQLKDPSTCLDPILWSFDNALPGTLATGQAALWTPNAAEGPNQWLPYALGALKLSGWIFVAMLLAGITGLLRKT